MRGIVLQDQALEDLADWIRTDRKTALRVLRLLDEARRHPFEGPGKPEPLRHLGSDVRSRRITRTNRLVYRVLPRHVDALQARYHD